MILVENFICFTYILLSSFWLLTHVPSSYFNTVLKYVLFISNLYCFGWKGVDWLYLSQDRDQWWALLNTFMNLWIPYKVGNFLTSWVTI